MKSPPRFVLSDDVAVVGTSGTLRVTGSELHHLRDVMRLGPGAELVLCSSNGLEYAGRIAGFEPNAAIIKLAAATDQRETAWPRLILAAGVIKPARMDLLIEKAAELNTIEFWPLMCARSVVGEPSAGRRERWHRISLAAAKQSQRSRTMQIHDPLDVSGMARMLPKAAFAAMCSAGANPLGAVIRGMANGLNACETILLAVGPEGDFTAEEMAVMRQAGFIAAGLGRTRLRSETAALAALSIVSGILAELEPMERHSG